MEASAFDRANWAGDHVGRKTATGSASAAAAAAKAAAAKAAAGSTFARWSARGRPPVDRLLLSLAAQFHAVDEPSALERLDELARPAFGIATLCSDDAGRRLIEVIGLEGRYLPGPAHDPEALMFDRVLASGQGSPELLAAVYLEVARRAGVAVSLLSEGSNWFIGLEEDRELTLIAPSGFEHPLDRIDLRRRCPHQLAHVVLSELSSAFSRRGRADESARALALRDTLPLTSRSGGTRPA